MSRSEEPAGNPPRFLVHHPGDSVAVAVADLEAGEVAGAVLASGERQTRRVRDRVPLGHKFALVDLAEGAEVIEYGVRIGLATKAIAAGEYVHVHNVRSARWPSKHSS